MMIISEINMSERERRMFLIQVAAGEDTPVADIHRYIHTMWSWSQ